MDPARHDQDEKLERERELKHPLMLARGPGSDNTPDFPDRWTETPSECWDTTGWSSSAGRRFDSGSAGERQTAWHWSTRPEVHPYIGSWADHGTCFNSNEDSYGYFLPLQLPASEA